MKFLFRMMMFIGVIIVIGTAGASDLNAIGFDSMICTVLFGALIFGIGYTGHRVTV